MITINNHVFVKLLIPEIDQSFDIYLPINKKIGNIINLINEAISEMTNGEMIKSKSNKLYNKNTLEKYNPDTLLYNTNIRNGSVLILLS